MMCWYNTVKNGGAIIPCHAIYKLMDEQFGRSRCNSEITINPMFAEMLKDPPTPDKLYCRFEFELRD